jgi:hypothetical protein
MEKCNRDSVYSQFRLIFNLYLLHTSRYKNDFLLLVIKDLKEAHLTPFILMRSDSTSMKTKTFEFHIWKLGCYRNVARWYRKGAAGGAKQKNNTRFFEFS